MHRNIFTKSMLRQPVRTAVLAILLLAAAFAAIMRFSEYIVLANTINSIGGYYRSIGFLRYTEGSNSWSNVFNGAELVSKSPYVAFEDRRRGAEGVLQGVLNADINGMSTAVGKTVDGRLVTSPNMDLFGMGDTERAYTSHTDAFFYGEVTNVERDDTYFFMGYPLIEFTINVDEVLTGYPEHIIERQEIRLRYVMSEDEFDAEVAAHDHYLEYGDEVQTRTAIDDIAIGERYFFRGVFPNNAEKRSILGLPQVGRDDGALIMAPLNLDTSGFTRKLDGDAVWYAQAPPGESVDPSMPGLERLDDELLSLRHNQSAVMLRTTADMTAMAMTQPQYKMIRLVDGRWLDREDQTNGNPVAVIQEEFALWRGLEIGDIISISVPSEQRGVDVTGLSFGTGGLQDIVSVNDIRINGVPEANPSHVMELEIVGLYQIDSLFSREGPTGAVSPYLNSPITNMLTLVFIPDSSLPDDLVYYDFDIPLQSRQSLKDYYGFDTEHISFTNFLLHSSYSFVLSDTRDESAFIAENKEALAALGYEAVFVDNGAENFWTSAEPILDSAAFNVVMFIAVLLVVFALVVFLYLRQRRKDFAISRALGRPANSLFRELLSPVFLFGLPAIIIGGSVGWFSALGSASNTLNPFGDIATTFDFALEISAPILWLPILIIAVIVLLAAMSLVGAKLMTRRPVLVLLQSR